MESLPTDPPKEDVSVGHLGVLRGYSASNYGVVCKEKERDLVRRGLSRQSFRLYPLSAPFLCVSGGVARGR